MIDPTDRPVYGPIHVPTPEPASTPRRRRAVMPWLIAAVMFAFALGLLTNPWFERSVRSRLPGAQPAVEADRATAQELAAMQTRLDSLEARAGEPSEPAVNEPVLPEQAPLAGVAEVPASVDARLAELQAQVAELRARADSSVAAAAEGAERAQTALLVAALRRAVDGGQRFDAYEPALRARFGASHPDEVAALLALTRRPVSADQLAVALTRFAPTAERAEAEGRSWWESMRASLAGVVTVRRADAVAADPQSQLRAAAARVRAGDVEGAMRLAGALPPAARRALGGWMADARRYAAASQALAALEVAALAQMPAPPTVPTATDL
jgi:hypothetical protein